jgi:hypothetical protein
MLEYLYRRQATAHFYTWHRFLNAWSVSHIPGVKDLIGEQDSLQDLCKHLASRPVILCLYGGPGSGHHVVASACDPGKREIYLYDSNHPGKTSILTQTSGGEWLHSESAVKWTGWFMDWGHYTDGTKCPRWPSATAGRATASTPIRWASPAGAWRGAGHDNHPDGVLPPVEGRRRTERLESMRQVPGALSANGCGRSFLPRPGMHLPQQNNVNWKELRVMTDGRRGEWLPLRACTSLVWGKQQLRQVLQRSCTPVFGESYVVDHRTV